MAKDEPGPARAAIIEEWGALAKRHPDRTRIAGGVLFFNYLQKKPLICCSISSRSPLEEPLLPMCGLVLAGLVQHHHIALILLRFELPT
jgi:hypothetical protein